MATKPTSTQLFVRSIALGVLLSMITFYLIHVFGKWSTESKRPDPETTASLVVYNTCALLGDIHEISPADDKATLTDGVDGLKLAASFMNFSDGHIAAIIIFAVVIGGLLFFASQKIGNQ